MRLPLFIISIFSALVVAGQSSYKEGDTITDFTAASILNSNLKTGTFNSLKKGITIIDFFGTWCKPCVDALPVLGNIQKKHVSQLAVILISIEKEAQLAKFVKSHNNFAFPIVIDSGNAISDLFRPPSYPYTVVISDNNQVIAITEASSLTDEKITEWLAQKPIEQKNKKIKSSTESETTLAKMATTANRNSISELSSEFIYAAKTGNETGAITTKLRDLNFDELRSALKNDDEKKAFWINIYNGYTQLLLKKDPGRFKSRNEFFKARQIVIAGKTFSLDDVEHGILRHSKIKWSLGYLNKIFVNKTERTLRVDRVDYRIHFALNCGAKSCPPIAFYDPQTLNEQLDIATRSYLKGESEYESAKNVLYLPALMNWFRRDFGGKREMKLLMKKINIIPEDCNPKIKFKKYDWDLFLDHYKTDN